MKIKYWMTKNPLIIGPDDQVNEASKLMREKGIHRLPVLEGEKLVGIITYRNILEARPSQATSLSVHEIGYLNAQLLVKDVMKKNPITVAPDDQVVPVMIMGRDRGIGSFPVLENGKLVGIITASDLFDLFLEVLGPETRQGLIVFQTPGAKPALISITPAFAKENIEILAFFKLPGTDGEADSQQVIRVPELLAPKAREVLTTLGYQLKNYN